MCRCIYIYIYMYTYIHTHISLSLYIYIYIYIYMYTHMFEVHRAGDALELLAVPGRLRDGPAVPPPAWLTCLFIGVCRFEFTTLANHLAARRD